MLGEAVYTVDDSTLRCDPGTKPGTAGASTDEKTSAGIRYMVKTPVNYNSNIAHPLLMVYAPGGKNRYESENYMYLTQEATAAGFIVAYADHRKMTTETIEELAEIPGLIEKKWCVDKKRIFLTGHSDGGTTAMGIAFMNVTSIFQRRLLPVRWASGVRTCKNIIVLTRFPLWSCTVAMTPISQVMVKRRYNGGLPVIVAILQTL